MHKIEAQIDVQINDKIKAKVVFESLKPEIKSPPSTRAKVGLEVLNNTLTITINANSISALRASINSYLRWISTILKCLDVIENIN